jgi:hypothetical protein
LDCSFLDCPDPPRGLLLAGAEYDIEKLDASGVVAIESPIPQEIIALGTLRDSAAALDIIQEARSCKSFFAELIGESGYRLMLGLGSADGCAQYSPSDGAAPHVMAVGNSAAAQGEAEQDFLVGGSGLSSSVAATRRGGTAAAPIQLLWRSVNRGR